MPTWEETNKKFKRTVSPEYTTDLRRVYDEPTYLGFKILFHFNDQMSPLLNINDDSEHTAYHFLKTNNYKKQAEYLVHFVEELQYVSQNSEWYFQSLEGLSELWTFDLFTEKSRTEKKLSITTLESLDLRISKCMDYYYKACFDTLNRREIVPINLRYFSMSIYITDIRYFHDTFYDPNGTEIGKPNIDLESAQYRPSLFIRMDLCEFDKTSRSHVLETVTNTEATLTANKISIKHWGDIYDYPSYILNTSLHSTKQIDPINLNKDNPQDYLAGTSKIVPDIGNKKTKINPFGDKALGSLQNNILGSLAQNIQSRITKTSLDGALNKIENFAIGTLSSTINNLINKNVGPLVLGNVYENGIRTVRQILDGGLSL